MSKGSSCIHHRTSRDKHGILVLLRPLANQRLHHSYGTERDSSSLTAAPYRNRKKENVEKQHCTRGGESVRPIVLKPSSDRALPREEAFLTGPRPAAAAIPPPCGCARAPSRRMCPSERKHNGLRGTRKEKERERPTGNDGTERTPLCLCDLWVEQAGCSTHMSPLHAAVVLVPDPSGPA